MASGEPKDSSRARPATCPARTPRAGAAARNPRGEATRSRILDAAEEMFAAQGFRATSLRDIAAAAKVELGLTTYYFGSKQGLVEAVLHRRAVAGERAMARALDRVEQSDARNDPVAILTAFAETIIVPLEREHPSGINYLRLVIRHAAEIHDAFGPDDPIMAPHFPMRARYVAALERALPTVNPAVVLFGFAVFEGAFSRMLFDSLIDLNDIALRRAHVAELRRCLVPFCAAGFRAFEPSGEDVAMSANILAGSSTPDSDR